MGAPLLEGKCIDYMSTTSYISNSCNSKGCRTRCVFGLIAYCSKQEEHRGAAKVSWLATTFHEAAQWLQVALWASKPRKLCHKRGAALPFRLGEHASGF